MASLFKKHPVAVVLSVLFHVTLVAFFVFGFDMFDQEIESKPPVNIVKATVIDESKIQAEIKKLKDFEQKKKRDEQKRLDKVKKQQLLEEKRLADLKKKQKDETKKIEQLKVAEAARQAKLKKDKAIAVAKKKTADKKKKADAVRKLAKQKADQEQAQRERELRAAAAEEEQERLAQKAIASFTDIIRQKVERNWIQPAGDISGLACVVRVKLIPGGEVVDAQVAQSSGNGLFDRSVEIATRKASPLPIPDDPVLFNQFRNLEFYFNPGE